MVPVAHDRDEAPGLERFLGDPVDPPHQRAGSVDDPRVTLFETLVNRASHSVGPDHDPLPFRQLIRSAEDPDIRDVVQIGLHTADFHVINSVFTRGPRAQYNPFYASFPAKFHVRFCSVGGLTVSELVALGRQPHTGFLGRLSAEDHQIVDQAIAVDVCIAMLFGCSGN